MGVGAWWISSMAMCLRLRRYTGVSVGIALQQENGTLNPKRRSSVHTLYLEP